MHQFYLKYLNKEKKIFEKYLHKYFREEFNMIIIIILILLKYLKSNVLILILNQLGIWFSFKHYSLTF